MSADDLEEIEYADLVSEMVHRVLDGSGAVMDTFEVEYMEPDSFGRTRFWMFLTDDENVSKVIQELLTRWLGDKTGKSV